MIDAYATQISYLNHLAPVWHALPPERRGKFYVELNRNEFLAHGATLGLDLVGGRPGYDPDPVLMAGGSDIVAGNSGRPVVFLEHGMGQSYGGGPNPVDSVSYSGGIGRDQVVLFLTPNEQCAAKNRARYPQAVHKVVGCPTIGPVSGVSSETIAISFHFDSPVAPESRGAWRHYANAVIDLAEHRNVIGHAHPRVHGLLEWWRDHGIEPVADFQQITQRACLYVCDNSCVTPDSLILCADLTWKPAGELKPGDRIIACDEERTRMGRLRNGVPVQKEDRRMLTTRVVANGRRMLACREVVTSHGKMTVSVNHPWLARREVRYESKQGRTNNLNGKYQRWEWVETKDLRPGDKVAHLTQPWQVDQTREGGWLAGMFDGEGNIDISQPGRLGTRRVAISVSQNPGLVHTQLQDALSSFGIPFCDHVVKGKRCRKLTLGGSVMKKLAFLATIAPVRLLTKARSEEAWRGAAVSRICDQAEVLSSTSVGEMEVATLQTESATFVAEGFIAHNSTLYEFAALDRPVVVLDAPCYRKNINHGLRFWNFADIGVRIGDPDSLASAVATALADPPEVAARRRAYTAELVPHRGPEAVRLQLDAILAMFP